MQMAPLKQIILYTHKHKHAYICLCVCVFKSVII